MVVKRVIGSFVAALSWAGRTAFVIEGEVMVIEKMMKTRGVMVMRKKKAKRQNRHSQAKTK